MTTVEQARADRDAAQLDLTASVQALLGWTQQQDARHHERDRREDLKRLIVPVPITCPPVPLAAGAGTITNMPDTLGPHDGFCWFIIQLTASSFTAGTLTVYRNFINDPNQLITFTSAGTFLFGSSQLYLGDSDMLALSATGITGQVTFTGWAIEVPTPLIPDYLL